jgi:ABC-type polysaccharide/polyol phosphate transport system ATPase subunit
VDESNRLCGLDLDAALTLHTGCHEHPANNQVQGPAIHVQGLEKSYQKLRVLRGVDLDVARGSIFALLGSNGRARADTSRHVGLAPPLFSVTMYQ